MSIQDWGAIGELAGSLFVLFTLFYLVLQVRANTQSNQLSMFESLTKDINDINMEIAKDPDLARVWRTGSEHPETLSELDADRYFFLIAQYLNVFNAIWGLRESGNIDPHFVRWAEHSMSNIIKDPGPWQYLQTAKGTLNPDFVRFLKEQRAGPGINTLTTGWRKQTNR